MQEAAVAVDPPSHGAVGIQELLSKLEAFAVEENARGGRHDLQSLIDTADDLAVRPAPRPTTTSWSLGDLANPQEFSGPLDLEGWSAEDLKNLLTDMISIRAAERGLAELVNQGHAYCPVHLAVGQEAVPVGVSHNLTKDDRVFGGHRSHGHYLALGGDLYELYAEVLGKQDGCSNGMGGSMHLFAPQVGFVGSVPIVAATVPIAVGAALAAQKDGNGAVAVAYFGDGACEEGGVHESLNLAAQMKLPVLFVCENNLFASHMDINQRQPHDCTARFADAHGIDWAVVDGNDVVSVSEAAAALIARARQGGGPGYLEAVTYRWYGHVGSDENIDVGIRRSAEELAAWKRRDPVGRLTSAMTLRGDIDGGTVGILEARASQAVATATARAHAAPYPPAESLLDWVYSKKSA